MGNQHAITDLDRCSGPDARAYADVAPLAYRNPPAVSKYHQLAPDMGVRADHDLVAVSQGISYSRGMAEKGALLKPAGRPADQSLDKEMQIHAIYRMRAISLERREPPRRAQLTLRRQIACIQY